MRLEKFSVLFLLFLSSFSHAQSKAEGKVKIPTQTGLALIEPLLNGQEATTTTLRVEKKNILEEAHIKKFLNPLLEESKRGHRKKRIHFEARNPELEGKKSRTTTFYGKKISFENGPVTTNIKLRARVYSELKNSGHFKRIGFLKDQFFLELKLKNAKPEEFNVSRKYRFLIHDNDLRKLFNLDTRKETFEKELKQIVYALKQSNPQKTKEEMKQFYLVLKNACLIDREFTKPLYVVEYSRQGFKFLENYSRRVLSRNKEEIEYQITLDKEIKVFKLKNSDFKNRSVGSYLKHDMKHDLLYTYEEDLCFLEFKLPLGTQERQYQKHSSCFKALKKKFFSPLFEESEAYGHYERDKGKLATATKALERKKLRA